MNESVRVTRPKTLHIVTDHQVGGVRSNLESLLDSRLALDFEFASSLIDDSNDVLRTRPVDLIVFHSACSWVNVSRLFALKKHARLIIQEHHYCDSFDSLVPSQSRFYMMLRLCYGLADQVVAISHNQADWMLKHRLVEPDRLSVIQQAKLLEPFLAIPAPASLRQPLALGAYGRFSHEKGFDILLDALRRLLDAPVRMRLGGDGPLRARLEARAEGLHNLEFAGLVTDVPRFLEGCDAVVVPSRRETWGYVCMEAKAAARPVVVTRVGGLAEQVEGCGISVPTEDPHSLADAILQLCALGEPTLRSWGQRGRESVSGAWEKYLSQWEDLFWRMSTSR